MRDNSLRIQVCQKHHAKFLSTAVNYYQRKGCKNLIVIDSDRLVPKIERSLLILDVPKFTTSAAIIMS